jgi:DNA-binding transcriptional LysR family regulator
MKGVTIHHLKCFDAVVAEGSFQAAALKLNRSHPTVIAAIKVLEDQLGVCLLDRTGYRVLLTEAGKAFHDRSQLLLRELVDLGGFAAMLAAGEESELRIVVGDLCPQPEVIKFLRDFFDGCKAQLHLKFEAIAGPWERLFDDDADLILHHIDKSDPRLEYVDLCEVQLVPVVAPSFLPSDLTGVELTPRLLRDFQQCVIRDTAKHSPAQQYFLVDGTPRCFVDDQFMKRELILQGMAWGHLPFYLIEQDLKEGRLVSIAGTHLPGNAVPIVAARLRDSSHGPVANRLWLYIQERVASLTSPLWAQG